MSDILVTVGGCFREIKPMNGEYYGEIELRHYVGEERKSVVVGNKEKVLIFDLDGKMKGRLPNRVATSWYREIDKSDWIAGDAILVERKHIK